LQNNRTCVLLSSGVCSPEMNLVSPNYQGRKSEVCVLGIEKCFGIMFVKIQVV